MIRPARSDKPLTLGLAEDLALGMGRSISYHFCAHLSGERERKDFGGYPPVEHEISRNVAPLNAARARRSTIEQTTNKQQTSKRAVQI
jgi:hypothetical protein